MDEHEYDPSPEPRPKSSYRRLSPSEAMERDYQARYVWDQIAHRMVLRETILDVSEAGE